MASICTNKRNGTRRIVFVGLDRKRRSIHCGAAPLRVVREVARHIDAILAAGAANVPLDATTAAWLGQLSGEWYAKLQAAGLVLPRDDASKPTTSTLAEFLDAYITKRVDAKPSSLLVFGRAKKHLVEFFGPDCELASITEGRAEDFVLYLTGKGLAEATIRKMSGLARQFFKSAVKHRLIASNPFDAEGIKTTVKGNKYRFRFITPEEAQAVLDACPDVQWRLIFALSRWGGLRCPSETLSLKWQHVDWERGRLIVPQPKVAHHGTQERIVPLFPELRPHLEAAWDQAQTGTEWIITRYRGATQNLRTQFERIIRRAGLVPWPRLFHNLRATRQTELADRFPAHVVSSWLGNSPQVAARHYLNTTEHHFQLALQPLDESARKTTRALQAPTSSDAHPDPKTTTSCVSKSFHHKGLDDRGLEHAKDAKAIFASLPLDGAPDDARDDVDLADNDPRLALLLELWERLDWDGRQALLDEAERIASEC